MQPVFLTEDVLTFIGATVGALLFLSCVFLTIYLKCRNNMHSGHHTPYLKSIRYPYPGSLMIQCAQISSDQPITIQSSTLKEIDDCVRLNTSPAAAVQLHPQRQIATYIVSGGSGSSSVSARFECRFLYPL